MVRPLPRAARAVDGPHRRLQADQGRRLLLARRRSRKPQLQRIYGTAFATKAELDAYLHQLEEAERRDHRRLGREMDLFHVQEEAAGSVFWHPHGWTLWRAVENYIRRRLDGTGYSRGQDAPALRPGVLGALRPLGEVPRATCSRWRPRSGIWR